MFGNQFAFSLFIYYFFSVVNLFFHLIWEGSLFLFYFILSFIFFSVGNKFLFAFVVHFIGLSLPLVILTTVE